MGRAVNDMREENITMIYHIKKIRERLMNSLVFLVGVTFALGFITCMTVLIQIPEYIDIIKERRLTEQKMELARDLEVLEDNYYDNSREIYATYQESTFYTEYDSIADMETHPEKYTDEYIHIYTMNKYLDRYVGEELLTNSQEDFSAEVSGFIRLYKDTLSENVDLRNLMEERTAIENAIKEMHRELSDLTTS